VVDSTTVSDPILAQHERLFSFIRLIGARLVSDFNLTVDELLWVHQGHPRAVSYASAPLELKVVGALEKLWPWIREEATRRGLSAQLTAQSALHEHAEWNLTSGSPRISSTHHAYGILYLVALDHAPA
jgi:hypothetical protein